MMTFFKTSKKEEPMTFGRCTGLAAFFSKSLCNHFLNKLETLSLSLGVVIRQEATVEI